jgi:hypothetical protein
MDVVVMAGIGHRRLQPPIPVRAQDVIDDRAGFRDHAAVVLDDGRLSERVHLFTRILNLGHSDWHDRELWQHAH